MIGQTISHYRVVARLGRGGMGVVYKAEDTRLRRMVALKFLPAEWSQDEAAKERFLREARTASAIDHPNICAVHDIEETGDGRMFIVMSYCEGRSLKDALADGPLPPRQAIDFAIQIADGLAKAHAKGIVHRDIKPANVMVTEDGIVKIVDFGLARFRSDVRLTEAGIAHGTVAYMSPEQTRGEETDHRTDVWALGIVLHEMLTGRPPFGLGPAEAVISSIRHDTPPALAVPATAGPTEELATVVSTALAKDPDARQRSARELATQLRRIRGQETTPYLPTGDTTTAPASVRGTGWRAWARRRGRLAAFGAAIGVLGIAAAGALWQSAGRDDTTRVSLAVVPVVNDTGDTRLHPYRRALTLTLVDSLRSSRAVTVVPYERLLEILRGPLAEGRDISSNEVVQAIGKHTGAAYLALPILTAEGDTLRLAITLQDPRTAIGVSVAEIETSGPPEEAAYTATAAAAGAIEEHFGARRSRAANSRPRLLAAAVAFERGRDAFAEGEYASAALAFDDVVGMDPDFAPGHAWLGRSHWLLGHGPEAVAHMTRAAGLVTPDTPREDAIWVQALLAEAHYDATAAEARYLEMIETFPDTLAAYVALADLHARNQRYEDGIAVCDRALARDVFFTPCHLQLARLYTGLRNYPFAERHAREALDRSAALGHQGGRAQGQLVLVDILNERGEYETALAQATEALALFEALGYQIGAGLAHKFRGDSLLYLGRLDEALDSYEAALRHGELPNVSRQAVVFNNMAVAYQYRGQHAEAVEHLRKSLEAAEEVRDERRVALALQNLGSTQILYGPDPDRGLADLERAMSILEREGSSAGEIFTRIVVGGFHSRAGQPATARRELQRALDVATRLGEAGGIGEALYFLGYDAFSQSEYRAARLHAQQAVDRFNEAGRDRDEAMVRTLLARILTRLGAFDEAGRLLEDVGRAVETQGYGDLRPHLYLTLGELSLETRRHADAERWFGLASGIWTDAGALDPASVEARAGLGLLQAGTGDEERGAEDVRASLAEAARMRWRLIETRARIHLAQIELQRGAAADALDTLRHAPDADAIEFGSELLAQQHHVEALILDRLGRGEEAQRARELANRAVEALMEGLGEEDRSRMAARSTIAAILAGV